MNAGYARRFLIYKQSASIGVNLRPNTKSSGAAHPALRGGTQPIAQLGDATED